MTVLQKIANGMVLLKRADPTMSAHVLDDWHNTLEKIEYELLPSSNGFDIGTTINREESNIDKLMFNTAFHAMDNGFYTEWLHFTVTVTPSLLYTINIGVKCITNDPIMTDEELEFLVDYIGEAFQDVLLSEYTLD